MGTLDFSNKALQILALLNYTMNCILGMAAIVWWTGWCVTL